MASSLRLYNLLIVFYNMLKVLNPGQSGILLYILKCSCMPPMAQEAEVTTILCLLYPPLIFTLKISNKKWLDIKVSLEFLCYYITNDLTATICIGY